MVADKDTQTSQENIKADVIILGCSLPGFVAAHKLKKKFGDTIDIVVLDLMSSPGRATSKGNISFNVDHLPKDDDAAEDTELITSVTARQENVAKHYVTAFAAEFGQPLPAAIIEPKNEPDLKKLFQFNDGNFVACESSLHEYLYLGYLERFELNQYQALLDDAMKTLFQTNEYSSRVVKSQRKTLQYYDQTSMEKHLSEKLLFATSKGIMRTNVKLVCGKSAKNVSVLFFLHVCYRSNSVKNTIDGRNMRMREKLLGYCKKRLSKKLQQSVADITLRAQPIRQIRASSNEQVVLETMLGESNYICSLLAMALSPEQLSNIRLERELLSEEEANLIKNLSRGKIKQFRIQYDDNFWRKLGYSGDIVSLRGPIIWAIERPSTSGTGSIAKFSTLIGYLNVKDYDGEHRDAVVQQLVALFGPAAANPANYTETTFSDVYVPRLGEYLSLYNMSGYAPLKYVEWGAFDIFADGDFAASIEAGHKAYLHLIDILRPQSKSFSDVCIGLWPTTLANGPITNIMRTTGIKGWIQYAVVSVAIVIGIGFLRSYFRQ